MSLNCRYCSSRWSVAAVCGPCRQGKIRIRRVGRAAGGSSHPAVLAGFDRAAELSSGSTHAVQVATPRTTQPGLFFTRPPPHPIPSHRQGLVRSHCPVFQSAQSTTNQGLKFRRKISFLLVTVEKFFCIFRKISVLKFKIQKNSDKIYPADHRDSGKKRN